MRSTRRFGLGCKAAFFECPVVAGMLVLVFGVGCASSSDRQRTTTEGSAVGGALGYGVSQAIGWLPGGPTLKRGVRAATTMGGMIAGAEYGDHVADKKAEFASQEEYLDACLAQATSVRNQLEAYNQELAQDIGSLNQQVEAVTTELAQETADLKAKRALEEELRQQLKVATHNVKVADEEIAKQRAVLDREADAGQRLLQLEE